MGVERIGSQLPRLVERPFRLRGGTAHRLPARLAWRQTMSNIGRVAWLKAQHYFLMTSSARRWFKLPRKTRTRMGAPARAAASARQRRRAAFAKWF
jgi:hypothetical protein